MCRVCGRGHGCQPVSVCADWHPSLFMCATPFVLRSLYVLDATSGALLFSAPVGVTPPPPAVTSAGDIVVCVGTVLTAFSLNGTVQWQAKLAVDGSPLSPTVVGDVVVIAVYNAFVPNVLAFDAVSGAPVWNFTSHGDIETPVAVGTDGTLLVSGAWGPSLGKRERETERYTERQRGWVGVRGTCRGGPPLSPRDILVGCSPGFGCRDPARPPCVRGPLTLASGGPWVGFRVWEGGV